MSDGLKVGERAWRITGGKHQGRLCWVTEHAIAQADRDKTKVTVTLVKENVPYYGTWADIIAQVNPKHLKPVYVVAKWSDEV